jgi:hypothetical protein
MLDPVRQAAPPPPSPPTPAPSRTPLAPQVAAYRANWNPPAAPPPPAPARSPAPEPQGFLGRLGSAISHGDVRAVAGTVRDGIGQATEAGRGGITSAVNWTGQTIGKGADFARSQIGGADIVSQGLRGAITAVEGTTRFSVGVTGGVLREGVSLVGTAGQLGTTLVEAQISPAARAELGQKVVGAVGTAADATRSYVSSAISDPSRVGGDLKGAWHATTGFVGSTLDRYGTALKEGRTEEIGMDVGTVATYVVPFGGGPARAALTAGMRGVGEGATRLGGGLLTRSGGELLRGEGLRLGTTAAREALPGAARQAANDLGPAARSMGDLRAPELRAANDAGPALRRAAGDGVTPATPGAAQPLARAEAAPTPLNARAQMAEHVYGRGELPKGTHPVTDAGELARLNLTPAMLDRGAFHAEVYATGSGADRAYTVAFRGSGGRAGDWVSNALQGIGLPSNHYARALEIGRAISRVDASVPVEFVGHSLGGGLASHAANASGRVATTFNAAALHPVSRLEGSVVAARAGVAHGTAVNYTVPGEFLTTAQEALLIAPRAFGTTERLAGIAPDGASFLNQYGPLAPINRHMMNWVLASTAGR